MKIRLPGMIIEGTPKEVFNYFMLTQGYEKMSNLLQKLSEVEFPLADNSDKDKKEPQDEQ